VPDLSRGAGTGRLLGVASAPDLTASALAGLLAEPARLKVFAAVVLGAAPADLPAATGLAAKQAASALHRLQAAGLLVGTEVAVDRLRALAAAGAPSVAGSPLEPFVRGRSLRSLPAQAERRWTVLAHVAAHTFQPGTDYDERTVNELLAGWCEGGEVDHAALRRYLVESGLMSRGSGVYRLGGGDALPQSPGEAMVRGMGLT
jgi:hypothetical protein